MTSEYALTTEIWELVRDFIPANKRDDVAFGLLNCLNEFGFERKDLVDIQDEDKHLSYAYHEVFAEDEPDYHEDEE